jgi:hypothetical protein
MLPFGVTIPATVPQGSEIPEGLMNNPVFSVPCTNQMYKIVKGTKNALGFMIVISLHSNFITQ